ncbi:MULTISPECIES: peroxiredoxin [Micrococcaceae]|uniref:Peroxiredoxin n=1 Tax=Pseudarthrobacter defluvii TaxID=410837 RepID=A0ABT9UH64_9MICC|nr:MULTISPECIES: peroxiredoxin [Micrococcaceae]MDE8586655.1 peroxiredoxin [Arthrobacter sp. NQ4]MDQ0118983.1 peroxiredoxin [Pseudarthrobacter defluvii]BCW79054.1 peroxiredoxin [Arthrobacter sp. NicSoilC5]
MTAAVEAASAAVPSLGAAAPDFELANQYGEPVKLSSFRGQNVALVFYPFAFSGICTGELCEIRDNLGMFEYSNAVVLAVSVDSKFSLRAYAAQEGYTFDLLADFWPHGAVANAYGVFDAGSGMAKRATFIIDGDGRVRYSVVNPRGQARDFSEYRAALADLKQA